MVRGVNSVQIGIAEDGSPLYYGEYYGLQADEKPIGLATGSKFVEVDTGKTYRFDEEAAAGSEWTEQPDSGGGGGGGGGVLVVGATVTETSVTLDKTWKEIKDAPYAVYIDAYEEGGIWSQTFNPIISLNDDGGYNVLIAFPYADGEAFKFVARTLTTDSENGYPSISM